MTAAKAPTVYTATAPTTCVEATPGAMQSAYTTFWNHLEAAHLQTSPVDQVMALLSNPSNYVLIHTVLIQNMIAPSVTDISELPTAATELLDAFDAHFYAAHLSTSPLDQVKALTEDPDGYVKLHTVLIENMFQPLLDWANKFGVGTAAQGCSAATTPGTTTPPAAAGTEKMIAIENMKFPAETDVAAGTKVTWMNHDAAPHTVTSMPSGPLKSGNIATGGTYSYTFNTPGTFKYVCDVHPDMQGTVVVK